MPATNTAGRFVSRFTPTVEVIGHRPASGGVHTINLKNLRCFTVFACGTFAASHDMRIETFRTGPFRGGPLRGNVASVEPASS